MGDADSVLTNPAMQGGAGGRRATAAQFVAANLILASGEVAREVDTGNEKIGDGKTRYVDLPYVSAAGLSVTYAKLAPDWVTGRAYVVGELVTSSGSLYRCTTAHTSAGAFDGSKFAVTGSGASALQAKQGLASAVVDAGGTGTHTTLAAAVAAVSAKATIHVISDLTITTAVQFDREVTVIWWNGAQVINNSSDASPTDTFASNVPIGSNGAVNFVRLVRPRVSRDASKTNRAGKAFNFHGAFGWEVWKPEVDRHADALYFDASPYPSGQGSHNSVYQPNITNCDTGIHFTGFANINQVQDAHTYSCGVDVWSESGLDNTVLNLRGENIGANQRTTPSVIVDGGTLYLPAFHLECATATNAFQLNGGAVFGQGNAYFTTGGGSGTVVVADAVRDMDLQVQGNPRITRSRTIATQAHRTTAAVANVSEWYGVTSDGGTPVLRAAVRSDGPIRMPALASDPVSGTLSTGDFWMKTLASGGTAIAVRVGSNTLPVSFTEANPEHVKLGNISSAQNITIFRAQSACTLLDFRLCNDGFVNYTATDYWTITFAEYNGNTRVGTIATYTQSAQIGRDTVSQSASSYSLAANRLVVAEFALTGAPPAFATPLIYTRYRPN